MASFTQFFDFIYHSRGKTSPPRVKYYRSRRHALIRVQIWGKSGTAQRKSFWTFITRNVKTASESFPDNCPTFYVKIIFDKFENFHELQELFLSSCWVEKYFSNRRELHFEDKIVDKEISSSQTRFYLKKKKKLYIRGVDVLSKVFVEGAACRVLLN